MVDDIVTMGAALARLHERRGIEMGDAQRFQIGNNGRGGVEIEIRRELQAVGGDRDGRRHYRGSRRQNTDQGGNELSAAAPQIAVPAWSSWCAMSLADRLAVSRSVA